jgi:hypothetical protein
MLVTAAPAELTDHTKAMADGGASVLNQVRLKTGQSWTMHQGGFDASRTSASTTATWRCRSG